MSKQEDKVKAEIKELCRIMRLPYFEEEPELSVRTVAAVLKARGIHKARKH